MNEFEVGGLYFRKDGSPVRYTGANPANPQDPRNWTAAAPPAPTTPGADELPEVGSVYTLQGEMKRYLGGDPYLKESWGPIDQPAAAQKGNLPDWRSLPFTGPKGQQPMVKPSGILTALGIAAPMAGPAGGGLLNVAARLGLNSAAGAALGGVEGGIEGAKTGAKWGAAAGAAGEAVLMPALRLASRRTAGRGARVAAELRRTTGVTNDLQAATREAEAALEKARADFYGPLEQQFAKVTDPEIMGFVRSDGVRTLLPRRLATDNLAVPSLADLQKLRGKLRKVDRGGLYVQFDEMLKERIPGLRDADSAYRVALEQRTSLERGRRSWNRSAAELQEMQRDLSPEALTKFREGQVHELARRLRQRQEGTVEALTNLMDAGPEARDLLQTMFPTPEAFAQFERVLAKEKSAARLGRTFRRLASPTVWGGVAAGAGAGYGLGRIGDRLSVP